MVLSNDIYTYVETGIFNALSQNYDIASRVGYHNLDKNVINIYNRQAKQGASFPFVLFYFVAGSNQNNTHRKSHSLLYRIQANALDAPTARELYGYINASLDRKELYLGNNVYAYQVMERQYYNELQNIEGNQYYLVGAVYEFLVVEN